MRLLRIGLIAGLVAVLIQTVLTQMTVTPPLLGSGVVTIANLASGTDGELITWDASGNPTTVPAGEAGEILASNGAGDVPAFTGITNIPPGESTITTTGDATGVVSEDGAVIRANNASLLTIHGIDAGNAGQTLTIISIGAGQVDLANQSATETTAANRIINGVTGTISLAAGSGYATLRYDATTARWRVIHHEQGAWITPTFAAGNFTGNASMTWTVAAGDVATYKYRLSGRTLTVVWAINTTTVGGTPSSALQIAIPGGFTAVSQMETVGRVSDAGGAFAAAMSRVLASGTVISSYTTPAGSTANWSASTDTTYTYGNLTFEVQ